MAKRQTKKSRKQPTRIEGLPSGFLGKLRDLEEQRRSIMDGARNEALKAAQAAIAALNNLGFNYQLTRGSASGKAGSRVGTRKVKDVPCPICGFKTHPPHDRRAHRGQGASKKPFTAAELQAKGLSKA